MIYLKLYLKKNKFSYHFINNNDPVPCYPFGYISIENLTLIEGENIKNLKKVEYQKYY